METSGYLPIFSVTAIFSEVSIPQRRWSSSQCNAKFCLECLWSILSGHLCSMDKPVHARWFYFDRSVTDSWSTTAWRCNKNIILDPPSLGQDDNSLRTTTATFPIWPKRIIIPFVIWLPQRIKFQQDFQVVRPVCANLNLHKYNKNSTRNECACIFLLIANLPLRTNVAQLTF